LNGSVARKKKPLRLIVIGSNAQLLPPPISDAFDKLLKKEDEVTIAIE
jgi:hypothetical protein